MLLIAKYNAMITKTLGTIIIIFVCLLMLPVAVGILGGFFGIVAGAIGAVFGIIGGIIGAIFGLLGWLFDSLFNWQLPHIFFNCNIFTIAAIILVVAIIVKRKPTR